MRDKLFGSSGIRGLANVDITPFLAQSIGMTLATLQIGGTIVVGRDTRTTGPLLEGALISGLAAGGADTISLGLVPTPILAWMIGNTSSNMGVEISASHNPPQYNGFKVFNHRGISLSTSEQNAIEDIIRDEHYELVEWDELGTVMEADAVDPYVDELMNIIHLDKQWRVACEMFSGATCVAAMEAFDALGVKAMTLNAYPDGHFPSGGPEPSSESLSCLSNYMKKTDAIIGFGFDGDGDRMVVVNEKGKFVSPDRVLAGYAGNIVEKYGGGVVVTHVGASMCIDYMVQAKGGSVIRTRVGDAFITETMEQNNAIFGGEPVGAWIHPDMHMCPDGLLSALKLMEVLEEKSQTLSEFVAQVPEYPLRRLKISCPEEKKAQVMEKVNSGYRDVFGKVISISTIDGVRLELEEGWVLIRPSGTEALIRVTAEGKDKKSVEALLKRGRSLVKASLS